MLQRQELESGLITPFFVSLPRYLEPMFAAVRNLNPVILGSIHSVSHAVLPVCPSAQCNESKQISQSTAKGSTARPRGDQQRLTAVITGYSARPAPGRRKATLKRFWALPIPV